MQLELIPQTTALLVIDWQERLCAAISGELRHEGPDRAAMLACLAGELDLRLRRVGLANTRRSVVAEAETLLELADGPLSISALARRLSVAPSTALPEPLSPLALK